MFFGTALLTPPCAFTIGALLPLLAWPQIRKQGRAGWYGVLGPVMGAWLAGIGAYFFFHHPDWMFSYLFEARLAPLGRLYPLFALAVIGAAAAGSLLASEAVLARRPLRAALIPLAGLAVLTALAAMTRDQLLHIGSTLEFRQDVALPFQELPSFQIALDGAGLLAGIPVLLLVVILAIDAWRTARTEAGPVAEGPTAPN
jgi:hypothetical protein